MLAFQMLENMGMTMGVVPRSTGILPFMSYGGSSLITTLACTGLVANVDISRISTDSSRGCVTRAHQVCLIRANLTDSLCESVLW